MSTWSRLTRYNRLSPAQAIRGKLPDMAKPPWSRLARCRALSLTRRLHDYVDLVLFYVPSALLVTPVTLTKLFYFHVNGQQFKIADALNMIVDI